MKLLFFLLFIVGMLAVLMAQEAEQNEKCRRGEAILCAIKCLIQGKRPESCNRVNGTISCNCKPKPNATEYIIDENFI